MFKIFCAFLNYCRKQLFFIRYAGSNKVFIDNPVKIAWQNIHFVKHHELSVGKYVICRGVLSLQKRFSRLVIGDRTFVGHNTCIVSTVSVKIGNDVLISHDCYITDTDGHSLDSHQRSLDVPNRWKDFKDWSVVESAPIVIEDNVWIGPKSIILKGITISKGAIVCAGSVVTKNVTAGSVVAGVPAKHLKATT